MYPYFKQNQRKYTAISSGYTQTLPGPQVFQGSSVLTFDFTDSLSGFKLPGWRQIIRNGGNATTPAFGTRQTFVDSSIDGEIFLLHPDGYEFGNILTGSVASLLGNEYFLPIDGTIPIDEIDNRALVGFLKKCKSAQRKLMVGVVAGELRETIRLIRNPAVGLRKLVSSYVGSCRGFPRGASPRSTLKHISNQWLEFSFGAKPLIADVAGAIEASQKVLSDLPKVFVSFRYGLPSNDHCDTVNASLGIGVPCQLARKTYRFYERRIRGYVRCMTTGSHGPVAETIGLTLPDFIPTVYELIPYSFLVDYFTNIGDVLEALSFATGDLVWHCDTKRETAVRTVSVLPRPLATLAGKPVSRYRLSSGFWTQTFTSFSRSGAPLGTPSFGLKLPNTWTKALNIGALASLRTLR